MLGAECQLSFWCRRGDSNSHDRSHRPLKTAWLPLHHGGIGAPGRTLTHNPRVRSAMLYTIELRRQKLSKSRILDKPSTGTANFRTNYLVRLHLSGCDITPVIETGTGTVTWIQFITTTSVTIPSGMATAIFGTGPALES